MGFVKGDKVLAGGVPGEIEVAFPTDQGQAYVVLRKSGGREVWMGADLRVAPAPEDPVRRKAVDLILEYRGVPRGHLFEYPYNEYESRERIRDAEKLLDDLLKVLEK